MVISTFKFALQAIMAPTRVLEVLNDWGDDAYVFFRHQVPKILAVLIIAFVLSRLLKLVSSMLPS